MTQVLTSQSGVGDNSQTGGKAKGMHAAALLIKVRCVGLSLHQLA